MGAVTYKDVYPTAVLDGCESALILFAAAFGGRQDAFFVAEASLHGTCVDIDTDRLGAMRENYPDTWDFFALDVFEFVSKTDAQWDVVSADPWTQDFDRTAAILPDLCRLARHLVILGVGTRTLYVIPDGWRKVARMKRSTYDGGVYWLVLERA